jgi:hypothetical protein
MIGNFLDWNNWTIFLSCRKLISTLNQVVFRSFLKLYLEKVIAVQMQLKFHLEKATAVQMQCCVKC